MSQELPQVTYEILQRRKKKKKVSGLGGKIKIKPILKPNIPAAYMKCRSNQAVKSMLCYSQ